LAIRQAEVYTMDVRVELSASKLRPFPMFLHAIGWGCSTVQSFGRRPVTPFVVAKFFTKIVRRSGDGVLGDKVTKQVLDPKSQIAPDKMENK
jgi:hypothetical protein